MEYPMTLSNLAPVLKEARKRAQLSQEQLALPLGMSRTTISALENGRCEEIGFGKLAALFDVLGLDLTPSIRKGRPTVDDLRAERLA
jgi:transcriptional regulator with XRE-family HTH domain